MRSCNAAPRKLRKPIKLITTQMTPLLDQKGEEAPTRKGLELMNEPSISRMK